MSGFEIAGIVLGALPILLEGGKALKSKMEPYVFWWKFKSSFELMLGSIQDQMIFYSQNMRFLVRPLHLESAAESELLNSRHVSPLWHDTDIQTRLRERVGHADFVWLMDKFNRLDSIVKDIMSILPIDNNKAQLPMKGGIDYETLRVSVSFTKKRKLLGEVANINKDIAQFLENDLFVAQASVLAPAIMGKSNKTACVNRAKPFLTLQSRAVALYNMLEPSKWTCTCGRLHQCGIGAYQRDGTSGRQGGSFRMFFGSFASPQFLAADFKTFPDDNITIDAEEGRVDVSTLSELKGQVRATNASEHKSNNGYSLTAAVMPTTKLGLLSFDNRDSQLSKNNKRKDQLGNQSPRNKKHVRFPPSPRISGKVGSPQNQLRIACDFLDDPSLPGGTGTFEIGSTVISISLDSAAEGGVNGRQITNFALFRQSNDFLDQRLHLGVKLAYTIIGLGTSVWLPQGWDSSDIQVSTHPPSAPFFTHECIRLALQREYPDPRLHAEMALFALGLALLELIFQGTIEQQAFYEQFRENRQAPDMILWESALEWQKMVEGYVGQDLADVVLRCVGLRFSVVPDLGKAEFVSEVLTCVIEPLENYIRMFQS